MGTVTPFDGLTKADLPIKAVLKGAKQHCRGGIVVISFDEDGELYFASSFGDNARTLWLIERAKMRLLDDRWSR